MGIRTKDDLEELWRDSAGGSGGWDSESERYSGPSELLWPIYIG